MRRGMGGFSEIEDLLTLQLCTRSKSGQERTRFRACANKHRRER